MEAATAGSKARSSEENDPRHRAARAAVEAEGDEAAGSVQHAAQGAELDEREEREALDYLLGARPAMVHDIPVEYETPDGMRKLTFVAVGRDTRKIDDIEQRHTNRSTLSIDRLAADAEIVAEFCDVLVDKSGREIKINSEAFRTVKRPRPGGGMEDFLLASTPMAIEERFRDQMGVISGVALEIKRICGFTGDRVGSAQRRLVAAAGN